jgi:hypothetical protein
VDEANSALLTKAVTEFLDRFDADGGTAPQYAGAVYAQVHALSLCTLAMVYVIVSGRAVAVILFALHGERCSWKGTSH